MSCGRLFHSRAPATAKARSPTVEHCDWRTSSNDDCQLVRRWFSTSIIFLTPTVPCFGLRKPARDRKNTNEFIKLKKETISREEDKAWGKCCDWAARFINMYDVELCRRVGPCVYSVTDRLIAVQCSPQFSRCRFCWDDFFHCSFRCYGVYMARIKLYVIDLLLFLRRLPQRISSLFYFNDSCFICCRSFLLVESVM